jgi:ribosomal protein L21
MYAVVDDRNQQYRVQPGDRIQIHLVRNAESEGDTSPSTRSASSAARVAGKRVGTPYVSPAPR